MIFRFFYNGKITALQNIELTPQIIHHIVYVLKIKINTLILCFNGEEEWECEIVKVTNKKYAAIPKKKIRSARKAEFKIHLILSIIKNDAMHEAISNATQLGAYSIHPVVSSRSVVRKVNIPKLFTIASQSSAQCNRITIPNINQQTTLQNVIQDFSKLRIPIIFSSEKLAREEYQEQNKYDSLQVVKDIISHYSEIGLLIGPEGGFSEEEFIQISQNAKPVSFNTNILRTETGVSACMQTIKVLLDSRSI